MLTSSLWILEAIFFAVPVLADNACQLPAGDWLDEPAVGKGFQGKTALVVEGPVKRELTAFEEYFGRAYTQRTDRATQELLSQVSRWAEGLPTVLDANNQVRFAQALRRWAGLYLRDTAPGLNHGGRQLASKKLAFFDKVFRAKGAPLAGALCLDEELSGSVEEAAKVRASLAGLRGQHQDIAEFSNELENQYLQRIRESPASPDRIYPYAAFLFSMNRLDEAEEQLRQAKALNPKMAGIESLAQALAKAKGMEDPVARARFIREYVAGERAVAEAQYRASQRRRPAQTRVLSTRASPTPVPEPPAPLPPRKRE